MQEIELMKEIVERFEQLSSHGQSWVVAKLRAETHPLIRPFPKEALTSDAPGGIANNGTQGDKVVNILRTTGEIRTAGVRAALRKCGVRLDVKGTQNLLFKLEKAGRIKRLSRGVYGPK